MSRYTALKEFAFGSLVESRSVIPDSGTSLAVEFWSGTEWVADSASPTTAPTTIFTRNMRVRLTPSVGGFFVDESDSL